VSITVQVTATFQSGMVIVSDCVELASGSITVQLSNSSSLIDINGKELELMRIERPECFAEGLNSTVAVVVSPGTDAKNCQKISGSKRIRESSAGTRSLVVVFEVIESDCAQDVPADYADSKALNIGAVAGSVVCAVVAVSAVVAAVMLWRCSKRRQDAQADAATHFVPSPEK
jgi:hypothetical protein